MRSIAVALIVVGVSLGSLGAQEKRLIAENDLLKFVWIADPQVSPDGSQVVFTRVTVNAPEDEDEPSLWLVPASGAEAPRRLTSGTRDTTPRWSPDGHTLAFVRPVERDGKTQTEQMFLLAIDRGGAPGVT